ncbi:hypothetical protein [Streptomyces sp. NPDC002082]
MFASIRDEAASDKGCSDNAGSSDIGRDEMYGSMITEETAKITS